MAEGSIWEAIDKAAYYKLGNLTVVALVIDGHDLATIDNALTEARSDPEQPTVVLVRTIKAKGVPGIEDKNGWHGKALPQDMAERAIAALGGVTDLTIATATPDAGEPAIHPTRP